MNLAHVGSLNPLVELETRDFWIAGGLALAVVVFAGAFLFVPTATGSFHDDAIYLSTARSLAAGDGYRLIDLPESPPQTKYPILYPAVLAVVWMFFPDFPRNLWLMQGLTLLSAAAALAVSYLYLLRFGYSTRYAAFASVALAATTPFLLFVSTRLLSEMPFALLFLLALWRLELVSRRAPGRGLSQIATGVIVALPFLCRSVGFVMIAMTPLLLWRARRPIVLTLVGAAITACPWIYWSLTALGQWQRDSVVGYYTDYIGSWSILLNDPVALLGWNLLHLGLQPVNLSLVGLNLAGVWLLDWKLSPLFLVAGALSWITIVRAATRLQILPVLLVSYALLLLLWPWPPGRFLLPVLPLVLAFAGQTALRISRTVLPTLYARICHLLLWAALAGNLCALGLLGAEVRASQFPFFIFPDRGVKWRSYEEVFSWIRANTAPADRIASGLDSMVFAYTDRQSFRPFPFRPDRLFYGAPGPKSGTAEEVLDNLVRNQTHYLAMFPMPGFQEEFSVGVVIADLRRTFPQRFVPVFVGSDPRFAIFEVR